MKRVVCISDTHEQAHMLNIPECDVVVHAGDITYLGAADKVAKFNKWAAQLKSDGICKEFVCIAGNHDLMAQQDPHQWKKLMTDVVYLEDELAEVEGLKIYGSPWTPSFYREHWVFNADRGAEIKFHWDQIPDCDILITHGPPKGIGDLTPNQLHVGCQDLLNQLNKIKVRMHVFGHIHMGYGLYQRDNTLFVNASSCTEAYKPKNPPILVTL